MSSFILDIGFDAIFDTQLVTSYLEKKDYEKIIEDKKLFLTTFYKVYKSENTDRNTEFQVSVLDNKIKVKGYPGASAGVKRCIEKIRQFLLDSKKEQSPFVNIVTIESILGIHLEKDRPLIDATKIDLKGIPKQFYEPIILPNLPNLAKACGLAFSQIIKSHTIRGFSRTETRKTDVLHFEWSKDDHLIYTILPKPIAESQNLGLVFYKMYEDQVLCDFKFTCQDDKIFQIHSNILYVNGGPVLQKMLTGVFKESQEKSITFKNYSSNTIADFIKFAYLGGKAFSDQYISSSTSEEADIFELFRFAHELQVSPLVDCCTSLISLLATQADKLDIKTLADQYGNEHLKNLYEHLNNTSV